MAKDLPEIVALSKKEALFVREYLVDLNGTQAAIRAGFSPKGAHVAGSRMLRRPKVAAALEKLRQERAGRTDITADRVLQELYRVAMSDIAKAFGQDGKLLPIHEVPEEARAAMAGLETEEIFEGEERALSGLSRKVKHWDKVKALELLGKHLGLFKEKVELTGKDGDALQVLVRTLKDGG